MKVAKITTTINKFNDNYQEALFKIKVLVTEETVSQVYNNSKNKR